MYCCNPVPIRDPIVIKLLKYNGHLELHSDKGQNSAPPETQTPASWAKGESPTELNHACKAQAIVRGSTEGDPTPIGVGREGHWEAFSWTSPVAPVGE